SFKYAWVLQVFLTLSMISSFVSMVIARHQLLLPDGAILKLRTSVRRGSYITIACSMHLWTIFNVSGTQTDDSTLREIMDCWWTQLKWRERRLNWFIMGKYPEAINLITLYGGYLFQLICGVFILLPLMHMLFIIMQARNKVKSVLGERRAHIASAKTILIQVLTLIAFLCLPFIIAVLRSKARDNVYARTQSEFICILLLIY
ncbi:hypothetical protein PMAYCL1PPCAC_05298, partial [Pristionchus mayeri]